MDRKFGMSGIGFAIVLVILFGIVMIISAPSFVDNGSKEENNTRQADDLNIKLQDFENRINDRLNSLEMHSLSQNANNASQYISNKYICTIEGNLDENGNVVDADSRNGLTKFVFVCEYKP